MAASKAATAAGGSRRRRGAFPLQSGDARAERDERRLDLLDRPRRHLHRHRRALAGRPADRPQAAVRQSRALRRCRGRRHPPDPRRAWRRRRSTSVKMGTTVATNALLERKGERGRCSRSPPASATRCGSATRRGRTSSRAGSCCPSRSTRGSIEVDERVTGGGEVLRPLDARRRDARSRGASTQGYRAVAIVLMHGWRWTAHEAALGRDGARDRLHPGLGQPRGRAADQADRPRRHRVVDAYLSPVLRRYVDRVVAGLGGDGRACSSCSRTAA